MQQTKKKIARTDLFRICKYKVYVAAIDSQGVVIKVYNGGKSPKSHLLRSSRSRHGVRLSPDISIRLDGLLDNNLGEITVFHPKNKEPRELKSNTGNIVFSRRRGEQVIIDKGLAIVTIMAFDSRRCTIHVAYAGRSFERFLVLGETPLTIIPKVKIEYHGMYGNIPSSKIMLTAPIHTSIDRHEVHMRKEFNISTIEEKRAAYKCNPQTIKEKKAI